jgi:hypothetical protein
MTRQVTEQDFRKPEFKGADPDDYEFRGDGAIVRKDRWERGMFEIARAIGINCRDGFEIPDIVHAVEVIVGQIEPQGEAPDED